jgi:predicted dehydrogenase
MIEDSSESQPPRQRIFKLKSEITPHAQEPQRTMSNLKIAVCGLGMGNVHIAGWKKHPQVTVVAACDLNRERWEKTRREHGVERFYDDWDALLAAEKPDVVSIATPNALHRAQTEAALAAGCHVLCEKPLSVSAADGRAMVAAATRAGKRLMVNFSYRFSAASLALKRVVDAGRLGRVYYARSVWHRRRGIPGLGGWFTTKKLSGGGPLIDLGVHRLDLALWLMGFPKAEHVLATASDAFMRRAATEGKSADVEDLAAAMISLDGGRAITLEASWAGEVGEREIQETRLWGERGGLWQRNLNEGYEYEGNVYTEHDGVLENTIVRPNLKEVPTAMECFADAIIAGTPHPADAAEALRVQEILDAIYRSAAERRPVAVG